MQWISLVHYQDPRTRAYLGSPSILRLPDGALLAVHDFFGAAVKNRNGECGLMAVYRSEDDGRSWRQITFLDGAFWGNLFTDGGAVYHVGSAQEYGDLVIRRSTDGGFTWTEPRDEHTGLLRRAGAGRTPPNYESSGNVATLHGRVVMPFVEMQGDWGGWLPERYGMFILSAPSGCDLLDADNYLATGQVRFDRTKLADPSMAHEHSGWLEGTPVETPEGKLACFARIHLAVPNYAVRFDLSDDFGTLSFDYDDGLVPFVGGHSKFEIRRDEKTGIYFTLTNPYTGPVEHKIIVARNELALAVSKDLRHWRNVATLLKDDSGLSGAELRQKVGFQYVDWRFDGDDIIYLCRTACDGAANFHNSNRITYHVIRDFRKYVEGIEL